MNQDELTAILAALKELRDYVIKPEAKQNATDLIAIIEAELAEYDD